MLRIVSSGLWSQIERLALDARRRRAAIAYVTSACRIPFRHGDLLVCDAGDRAISSGETAAAALRQAFEREVTLYSLTGLHAKIALFDAVAVIGSANLSSNSTRLVECAVITDRPEAVAGVTHFIEALIPRSEKINEAFLRRIEALPVNRRGGGGTGARAAAKISLHLPCTWLVGTYETDRDWGDPARTEATRQQLVKESGAKDEQVDSFWWTGHRGFNSRARAGDLVVHVSRPRIHDRSGRGVEVYKHATILKIERRPGTATRRYYCRWPADAVKTALSWRAFLSVAKSAGLPSQLSVGGARKLTPSQSDAIFDIWGTRRST